MSGQNSVDDEGQAPTDDEQGSAADEQHSADHENPPVRDDRDGASGHTAEDDADVAVPAGATPHVCGYCGQPFPEERYLVLHHGLEHYGRLSESEREAFGEAYESEGAEIRRFRLVALGALVLLYFGFLFMYAAFA